MRFTCLRWFAYAFALAVPALAQPTLISSEMPHVEMSVGAGGILGGPAVDLEREMTRLGLDHDEPRVKMPHTGISEFPPAFAQIHVGVREHTMVGFLISSMKIGTVGRAADASHAFVEASMVSRALLVSYRPNPWIKIGAGPALHRRTLELIGAQGRTREQFVGWLASGDVKFARRPLSYQHPPTFGYVTAQYRGAPALLMSPGSVSLSGPDHRVLNWPGSRVRFSHWLIGVGVGFEI